MPRRGLDKLMKACIATFAVMLLTICLPMIDEARAGEGTWPYHSSLEIDSLLSDMASARPDIAVKTTARELLGIPDAEGGRPVPILFIGNMSDTSRPNLMFIGAHHGNEPDSAEAVLAFASYVLLGGSGRAQRISLNVNMIILPVVNPYGLDMGIRYDERGEDPNRDYPFMASPSSAYSDGIPLNTIGARTVHELARMYPLQIALSFHTGSWGIFTPWGAASTGNKTPDHESFMELASAMSRASGQNMPYGPANDFQGVSYLMGAFDDHLYGSSVLPDRLQSQDMIIPHASASFTVELRTGLGKEPEGLGSLDGVDGPSPSLNVIPSAVRMCVAACMMASVDVSWTVKTSVGGISLSFDIGGVASYDAIWVENGGPDGSVLDRTGLDIDPLYPEISFGVTPPEGSSMVHLRGDPRAAWREHLEGAYPNVSPRSILSLSAYEGMERAIELPVRSEVAEVEILGIEPYLAPVDGVVQVSVMIDTPDDESVSGLSLVTISKGFEVDLPYTSWELVQGENVLQASAGIVEGPTVLELRLQTSMGMHVRRAMFYTIPWVSVMANHDPSGHVLHVIMGLEGSERPAYVNYLISPSGDEEGASLGPFTRLLAHDEIAIFDIDVSMLDGTYSLLAWTGMMDPYPFFEATFTPSMSASEMPVRVDGGSLVLGPVTVFKGRRPTGGSVLEGDLRVVAVLISANGGETRMELNFVPFDDLAGEDALIVLDQASRAGSHEAPPGAYLLRVDLPEPGHYEVTGYVEGPSGPLEFGSGVRPPPRASLIYDSFEVKGREVKRDPPYALILLFVILIIVISVVTYLRYPARMKVISDSMEKEPRDRSIRSGVDRIGRTGGAR